MGSGKTIPLIRAAALIPLLKWLEARGRPIDQILRDCGIGYVWIEDTLAPVPIRALERLAVTAARLEGPDVGIRAVSGGSLGEIGALGAVALGARTPGEALALVGMALPLHCSHELLSLHRGQDKTVIHEYWNLPLDPVALHIFQQFVAGIIHLIIRPSAPASEVFLHLNIVPHPQAGLEHLRPWFGDTMARSTRPRLEIAVPNVLLDMPFSRASRHQARPAAPLAWKRLQDGTVVGPARHLIRAMLHDSVPSVEHLALAADMSVRTLQRRLSEEGATFSLLLEEGRREAAMAALSAPDAIIGAVSAELGYARQSSLSRAVRRWTGLSPAALRTNAATDPHEAAQYGPDVSDPAGATATDGAALLDPAT